MARKTKSENRVHGIYAEGDFKSPWSDHMDFYEVIGARINWAT